MTAESEEQQSAQVMAAKQRLLAHRRAKEGTDSSGLPLGTSPSAWCCLQIIMPLSGAPPAVIMVAAALL